MSIDNKEKSADKLFEKIKKTSTDYDILSLLKTYSDNYNTEQLNVLKKDMLHHLEVEKYYLNDGAEPKMILKYLSIKLSNNLSIPFNKGKSKKAKSYQLKINDYVQNNIEEIKSYNGYRLETEAIKSPLNLILSDLISEIDVKEVFDLEELIFKYEFKNWRKFIELIDEKLNDSPTIKKIDTLKWKGTKADFVELSKALILSDMFNGTQKEIVDKLSTFLDIDIKNYDQKLIQIKGRNNGSETLFLNKLKQNLDNYFKK